MNILKAFKSQQIFDPYVFPYSATCILPLQSCDTLGVTVTEKMQIKYNFLVYYSQDEIRHYQKDVVYKCTGPFHIFRYVYKYDKPNK